MLEIKPTENTPLVMGKCKVFPTRLEWKGKQYQIEDILHIEISRFKNTSTIAYMAPIASGENIRTKISMKSGDTISTKKGTVTFLGSSPKKLYSFEEALNYLSQYSFRNRYLLYVKKIREDGFLSYDNTKFFIDGTIITRRGREIHLDDYSIKQEGLSIYLVKTDIGKFRKIGRSIINWHPNTNCWKTVFHGEFTLSFTLDRDVIHTLLSKMYFRKYVTRY